MSRRKLRLFSLPACEPQLSRGDRRARGVYYTPPEIVRLIIELTLTPRLDSRGEPTPRVLDLACGAGEFLIEAQRQIIARHGKPAARTSLVGIDIDSTAIDLARHRLKQVDPDFPNHQLVVGDALGSRVFPPASFDVIVGNPPYVNIRQLSKILSREQIDDLRQRFRSARGNFDLYALFLERAVDLLRPGGSCGLVIPNKWATLDYARTCRAMLLAQTTIEHVIDCSTCKPFAAASVYPHVLVFRKERPAARHTIHAKTFGGTVRRLPQRYCSADAISLSPSLDVESRVATSPLDQLAALNCGTAGYSAQRIATWLRDQNQATSEEPACDFITSGNIDRYAIRLGNVRYLNRDYVRPRLPLDIPELTPAKRQMFQAQKIVIAGMSRRLEAAWDDRGLALGVQVFAASNLAIDPYYLLAVLNSKLLSYLFATRFAAKRLGGGYLAINKGQLARLPVRLILSSQRSDVKRRNRVAVLGAKVSGEHDFEIDELIYKLYRLTPAEIATVEGYFGQVESRAA